MNVYDSLKIQELLGSIGFSDSSSFFDADLIILNTCHIREKATEKVYSELGKIKKSFKNDIEFGRKIIAVMGCVAQAEGDEIFKRTPYVDIVIGPQSVHNLPTLVTEAMERRRIRYLADTRVSLEYCCIVCASIYVYITLHYITFV